MQLSGGYPVLTSKQKELLLFIHERIKADGVSPSFDEMKAALNLASKSGIHRLIVALEERGFIRRLPNRATPQMSDRTLPVLGRIAAGVPIEAIQQEVDRVTPPAEFADEDTHYALEVKGDSMIDAGILDRDVVILRRAESATSGDIVVALIDDQEATLKRLRKKGDSVALEAANPAYETRIFGPDRVKVQGRLVALIRRYA